MLFVCLFKRVTEREKEREFFYSLVDLQVAAMARAGAKSGLKDRNFVQVSLVSHRNSCTWAIFHCFFPGH